MAKTLRIVLFFCLALGCFACGGSGAGDDGSGSDDALASSSQYLYVAPPIQSGGHTWQTVVMQNGSDFEGTLAFRRASADADPDQLVVIDKKTNAVSFVSLQSMGATDDWESSRKELGDASGQFTQMAGDFESGDTRLASVVNDQNKCFIKEAAIALALVGAIVAAPFVIEAAPALVAGAVASAQDAGAAIASNGIRAFATQAAKTAIKNPAVRKLVLFHVAKDAVKGWLLFSAKGHELTHDVLDQAKEVWNAKCELPSPDALSGTMIMSRAQ